jgi:preprotein translocase subunit SecE
MPARAFKNALFVVNMTASDYIKETKAEMKHVSWPTRRQAVQYTLAVIGFSIVTGLMLFAFDQLYLYLIKTFILKY